MNAFIDYFNVLRTRVANPLETEDRISSTTDYNMEPFFPLLFL